MDRSLEEREGGKGEGGQVHPAPQGGETRRSFPVGGEEE